MTSGHGPAQNPYLIAAALRATFEPEDLAGSSDLDGEWLQALLEHSTVVEDPAGKVTWSLRADARREAIATLHDREAILRACREYPAPQDNIQATLIAQLEGNAKPLPEQTPAQLALTLQVTEWLSSTVSTEDDPASVRSLLDRELLIGPFRLLVGEHFAGRETELQKLSDYVGVRRTGSVRELVRRRGRQALGFVTEPPLLVWGAGGIGKSSLLAKFLLDHAYLEGPSLPFAYLDFDRAAVRADNPITIVVEAARQLAVQANDARPRWESRRREWAKWIARPEGSHAMSYRELPQPEVDASTQSRIVRDFALLFADTFGYDVPFLLVLDTFEEVQYQSRSYVTALWDFLEALQTSIPGLRTVIAGRAPIDDRDTQDLELPLLDHRAAVGYLRSRGIDDPDIADFIVAQFGGNPLTLRLAADIVRQDKGGVDALRGVRGRRRILRVLSASQETMQRALYRRILDRIHDDQVRALAHPGLTMRRVTSDVIVRVLAEPCGIELAFPDGIELAGLG